MRDDAESDFRELYERSHRAVLNYFRRRLPPDDVWDAAADVFLVAWRRLDDVPEGDETLPWLYGVAHNVLRNRERSHRRRWRLWSRLASESGSTCEDPRIEPNAPSQGAALQDAALLEALSTLSHADREILRLAYWEQLPHRQIAQVLGCTTGAIDVRLHRARRRLRKVMGSSGHEVTESKRTYLSPQKGE